MKVPVINMSGDTVGEIELNPAVFEAPVNASLMHQALTRQLANARQGNAKTKNRSEVNGSTRKMWKQKGTGRARQGSRRARCGIQRVRTVPRLRAHWTSCVNRSCRLAGPAPWASASMAKTRRQRPTFWAYVI